MRSEGNLSREQQLLLVCARITFDDKARQQAAGLLETDLDWTLLVSRAVRWGIPTLACHHLRSLEGWQSVPGACKETLERAYQAATLLGMRQRFEAGRVLGALSTAGIGAIALKGLALTETVYPSPALRPSGDIDVLVHAAHAVAVEGILQALGYEPDERYHPCQFYRPGRFHHLAPHRLPGREVIVEAHWDLAAPMHGLTVDVDGLWSRAETALIAGQQVGLLAPEDLLLHLGLHVVVGHHLQTGLRHLVDVAETLRTHEHNLDWQAIVDRAHLWQTSPALYLALYLAQDLLDAPVPQPVLRELQAPSLEPGTLAAARERVLGLLPLGQRPPVSRGLGAFFGATSLAERLRLVRQHMFPPWSTMIREYGLEAGTPPGYRYYVRRPLDLARRYLPLTIGAALGNRRHRDAIERRKQDMGLDAWFDSLDLERVGASAAIPPAGTPADVAEGSEPG